MIFTTTLLILAWEGFATFTVHQEKTCPDDTYLFFVFVYDTIYEIITFIYF